MIHNNINKLKSLRYAFNTNPYSSDGKWGYKDIFGNIVIPANFDGLGCHPRGRVGSYYVCKTECNFVDDNFYEGFATFKTNILIEESGIPEEILADYQMGLISYENLKLYRFGYIDLDGNIKIEANYLGAFRFSEGMAAVISPENEKFGYINKDGDLVIPFDYDTGSDFKYGLAYVTKNGKGGFINQKGETIIPFNFEGKCGCREMFNDKGLVLLSKDDIPVVINLKNETIYTGTKDYWYSLHGLNLKFAKLQKYTSCQSQRNNEGIIDLKTLKLTNIPQEYKIDGITNKFIILGKEESWEKFQSYDFTLKAYFDLNIEQLTPFKYNYAFDFIEGLARVGLSDGRESNNNYQDAILTLENLGNNYQINTITDLLPFQSLYQLALYKFKFGFINENGNEIIPCKYFLSKDFHEDLAAVCNGNKWGYIDKNGGVSISFEFDWADDFKFGFARVLLNDHIRVIDKNGKLFSNFKEIEMYYH